MRPAQHLDPRADLGLQRADVELAREGIGHLDPVDQHQHVIGFRTAQADLGLARDACDRDAGNIAQHIGNVAGLAVFERVSVQHRCRSRVVFGQQDIAGTRGADDDIGALGIGNDNLIVIRFAVAASLCRQWRAKNQRCTRNAAQQ